MLLQRVESISVSLNMNADFTGLRKSISRLQARSAALDAEKVEAYTRALLEAARSEGRANSDLVQWQHAKKFTPEVLETLAAMQREVSTCYCC